MRPFVAAALWAVFFFALNLTEAKAADPRGAVARADVSPGQISWITQVESPMWVLTVSGQDIYYRESFEDGAPPTFRAVAPDGERFVDGNYKWELRAVKPESGPQEGEEGALSSRATRARSQRPNVLFRRRVIERPIVASGSFQVENGAFVMRQPEPDEDRLRPR